MHRVLYAQARRDTKSHQPRDDNTPNEPHAKDEPNQQGNNDLTMEKKKKKEQQTITDPIDPDYQRDTSGQGKQKEASDGDSDSDSSDSSSSSSNSDSFADNKGENDDMNTSLIYQIHDYNGEIMQIETEHAINEIEILGSCGKCSYKRTVNIMRHAYLNDDKRAKPSPTPKAEEARQAIFYAHALGEPTVGGGDSTPHRESAHLHLTMASAQPSPLISPFSMTMVNIGVSTTPQETESKRHGDATEAYAA